MITQAVPGLTLASQATQIQINSAYGKLCTHSALTINSAYGKLCTHSALTS